MRWLLDTQVFLWALQADRRLTAAMRAELSRAEGVYVSAASIWEIAIKASLGKIDGDPDALTAAIEASGFEELPATARHAAAVANLPAHHHDPFDRLLLAQAFTEPMGLMTADTALAAYGGAVRVI